jgi:hypothetical protein
MIKTPFLMRPHSLDGCNKDRIHELEEQYDHEYYMSALPLVTSRERAVRGRSRIAVAIEEFKKILEITKCKPCCDEIANQILLQEESLREIDIAWNM